MGEEAQGRLARWAAGLAGGLGAHPSAQAKGSLVRALLEGRDASALAAALPPVLRKLVQEPPIGSEWVPEAWFCGLLLAIADLDGMTDAQVLAWSRRANRALFESPVYRILMIVATPEAMLRHAGRRWANFHRGTALTFDGFADDGARLTLEFPDGLYDALLVRTYGEAFAAALELASAKDPQVTVEAEGRGFARYVARW